MDIDYIVADPTGNITVLVRSPYSEDDRDKIISTAFELEPACEQVGFISSDNPGHIQLEMMGYEFCGNASLSAASWQAYSDGLEMDDETMVLVDSSGISETLNVHIRRLEDIRPCDSEDLYPHFTGRIMMPVPRVSTFRDHPVVHLDGISHMIVSAEEFTDDQAVSQIKGFANDLDVPALGILLCNIKPESIRDLDTSVEMCPLVYVRDSDTLVWEHGCATGSTAIGYYRYFMSGINASKDADSAGYVTDVLQPGGLISINIKNGRPELTGHVILRKY